MASVIFEQKSDPTLASRGQTSNALLRPVLSSSRGSVMKRLSSSSALSGKQREEQEFLLSVLSSSTTKRDARGFLTRYKDSHRPDVESVANNTSRQPPRPGETVQKLDSSRVGTAHEHPVAAPLASQNTAGAYARNSFAPSAAMARSPRFLLQDDGAASPEGTRKQSLVEPPAESQKLVHVAIVKLAEPHLLNEEVLDGVCITLVQLAKLGMRSIIVMDIDQRQDDRRTSGLTFQDWRKWLERHAGRISDCIHRRGGKALVLPECVSVEEEELGKKRIDIQNFDLLHRSLLQGIIAVVPPIGWQKDTYKATWIPADEATLAIVRNFTQPQAPGSGRDDGRCVIERMIVLDRFGGIPSSLGPRASHVFVNLEDEYGGILERLNQASFGPDRSLTHNAQLERPVASLSSGYVWSPRKGPFDTPKPTPTDLPPGIPSFLSPAPRSSRESQTVQEKKAEKQPLADSGASVHAAKNLTLVKSALSMLPAASSALIIAPHEVALAAKHLALETGSLRITGVQTRRHKNPLIHNLLTDKSAVSPSLPSGRLASLKTTMPASFGPLDEDWRPATFVKTGMPLRIIPGIDLPTGSLFPPPSGTSLDLATDGRIDLDKLTFLINDSFNRQLDVGRYLDRVQNKIAAIVVAGDYEGGAILTWEAPDDRSFLYATDPVGGAGTGVAADRLDPSGRLIPPVPYLDKFAVLKKSQGVGGVADIVFNGIVRTVFPAGVAWRSRKTNPVNRWYFERAAGTWRIPGEPWTAFWTGDLSEGAAALAAGAYWRPRTAEERFQDYVRVCRGIRATWVD